MGDIISVIIPAYNTEKYLERCINSIAGQSYRDLELIIVDDHSGDRTGEIADRLASSDDRIRVIHLPGNTGIASARNAAIDVARGSYIGFVDSDDFIHKDMYLRLHSLMVQNDADIVLCNEIAFRNWMGEPSLDSEPEGKRVVEDHGQYIRHFMDEFTGHIGWCWNKLYRADYLKQIRFRKYGYEDLVFNAEYARFVKKAVWTGDKLYAYRITEESTTAAGKKNMSGPAAESFIATRLYLADNSLEYTNRYQVYTLGKVANIYANCRKRFGKEAAAEVYNIYIREYENRSCRALSVKDAFKLWLARYMPFVYCMMATRDVL